MNSVPMLRIQFRRATDDALLCEYLASGPFEYVNPLLPPHYIAISCLVPAA